jgi:hypothetical protein
MSKQRKTNNSKPDSYAGLMDGIPGLLESARRTTARAVNAVMTATYWEVARRISSASTLIERRYNSSLRCLVAALSSSSLASCVFFLITDN